MKSTMRVHVDLYLYGMQNTGLNRANVACLTINKKRKTENVLILKKGILANQIEHNRNVKQINFIHHLT